MHGQRLARPGNKKAFPMSYRIVTLNKTRYRNGVTFIERATDWGGWAMVPGSSFNGPKRGKEVRALLAALEAGAAK
jgi:hypothetical protein